MNLPLLFILTVLAAYRVWRLLFRDTLPLVAGPRDRLVEATTRRHGEAWAEGWECPWCTGTWVALGAVGIVWVLHPLPMPGLWFLAVAAGVGALGEWL